VAIAPAEKHDLRAGPAGDHGGDPAGALCRRKDTLPLQDVQRFLQRLVADVVADRKFLERRKQLARHEHAVSDVFTYRLGQALPVLDFFHP